MSNCPSILKSMPETTSITGFSASEIERAICRAVDYIAEPNLQQAISKSRTTIWPWLTKAVDGGLQHVVSADNAAGYAELWHRGGNWYAVTGADADGSKTYKSANGLEDLPILRKSEDWGATWEIKYLNKGSDAETATALFLAQVFGPLLKSGADCGCKARKFA